MNGVATPANIYLPQCSAIDWDSVLGDATVALVVTNSNAHARRLCSQGQPTIAVSGMSQRAVRRWLQRRGANVIEKGSMH
mgnify:CR=1 FL=1